MSGGQLYSSESPRFEDLNGRKDYIKYNKNQVAKSKNQKTQGTSSKTPMNKMAVVQFCLQEDLKETDIDINEIVSKSKIIRSKRIMDEKLHSNVPPKPHNIFKEKNKKKSKSQGRTLKSKK